MTQFIATTVALLIAFSFPTFAWTSAGTVAGVLAQDDDPEAIYKERREEAGKDPVKLWELHLWCEAYGMEKEAKSCARAVVKYDESHKEAHEYLGHVFYDGQWFTSERKLERFEDDLRCYALLVRDGLDRLQHFLVNAYASSPFILVVPPG